MTGSVDVTTFVDVEAVNLVVDDNTVDVSVDCEVSVGKTVVTNVDPSLVSAVIVVSASEEVVGLSVETVFVDFETDDVGVTVVESVV